MSTISNKSFFSVVHDNFFSFIVVAVSVFLMQYHAIHKYIEIVGKEHEIVAWVWSIGIEYVALWSWFQAERNRKYYLMSVPLSTIITIVAFLNMTSGISSDIAKLEKIDSLAVINKNISAVLTHTSRLGVHDATRKGMGLFVSSNKKMEEAIEEKSKMENVDRLRTQQVIFFAGLFFIMIASIVATSKISRGSIKVVTVTEGSVTPKDDKKIIPENSNPQRGNGNTISPMSKLANKLLLDLEAFGNEMNLLSETAIRNALPSITAPFFSRLRDTVRNGSGVTTAKMDEVREDIRKYKKARGIT